MNDALLSSKKMDWCTPIELFNELDREFHFDLDAAATAKSAKCKHFFTPEENGLLMDWGGHTVFCNPPYGRSLKQWVKKAYEERKKPETCIVMLIPARTDTSYFHEYIYGGKADEIRFLRGRIVFTNEDGQPHRDAKGKPSAAPFPSMVVVWSSKKRKGRGQCSKHDEIFE